MVSGNCPGFVNSIANLFKPLYDNGSSPRIYANNSADLPHGMQESVIQNYMEAASGELLKQLPDVDKSGDHSKINRALLELAAKADSSKLETSEISTDTTKEAALSTLEEIAKAINMRFEDEVLSFAKFLNTSRVVLMERLNQLKERLSIKSDYSFKDKFITPQQDLGINYQKL